MVRRYVKLAGHRVTLAKLGHALCREQALLVAHGHARRCRACRTTQTTGRKLDKDVFRRDLGNLVEAYQEVARRLGIMNENEPNRPTGPVLVK